MCSLDLTASLICIDLSKNAVSLWLHISEFALLPFGLILAVGIVGEYLYFDSEVDAVLERRGLISPSQSKGSRLSKWRNHGKIAAVLVIIGVLGEFLADAGVYEFSKKLQTISDTEVSALNLKASSLDARAKQAESDIATAKAQQAAAEAKIADANQKAETARSLAEREKIERLKLEADNDYRAHLIQQLTLDVEVFVYGLPLEPFKQNFPSDIELLNHGRPVAGFVLVDPVTPTQSLIDQTVQTLNGNFELYPNWRDSLITHPMKELNGIDGMNIEYGPFDVRTPELLRLAEQKEMQILGATFGATVRMKVNVAPISFLKIPRDFFHKESVPDRMLNQLAASPVMPPPNNKTVPVWPAEPCVGGCGDPQFAVIAEAWVPGGTTFPSVPLPVSAAAVVNLPACTDQQTGFSVAISRYTEPVSFYYQYRPAQEFPCGGTFKVDHTPEQPFSTTAKGRIIAGQLMLTINVVLKETAYADVPALFDSIKKRQAAK